MVRIFPRKQFQSNQVAPPLNAILGPFLMTFGYLKKFTFRKPSSSGFSAKISVVVQNFKISTFIIYMHGNIVEFFSKNIIFDRKIYFCEKQLLTCLALKTRWSITKEKEKQTTYFLNTFGACNSALKFTDTITIKIQYCGCVCVHYGLAITSSVRNAKVTFKSQPFCREKPL